MRSMKPSFRATYGLRKHPATDSAFWTTITARPARRLTGHWLRKYWGAMTARRPRRRRVARGVPCRPCLVGVGAVNSPGCDAVNQAVEQSYGTKETGSWARIGVPAGKGL